MITDKTRPYTPRLEKLDDLVAQIQAARGINPNIRLLLGHGSGSFGHVEASKYGTRQGVWDAQDWQGFNEVWYAASALNRLVMDAFHGSGLQVMTFPPSASVIARDGQVATWELSPLKSALDAGIIPVVYGDAIFDMTWGGTILSTEDLFSYLAGFLHPQRILLAGLETGVWEDFPRASKLIHEITPQDLDKRIQSLGGSAGTDVTGGMDAKVHQMLALVQETPELDVLIFSGEEPGNILKALLGDILGTHLHN